MGDHQLHAVAFRFQRDHATGATPLLALDEQLYTAYLYSMTVYFAAAAP